MVSAAGSVCVVVWLARWGSDSVGVAGSRWGRVVGCWLELLLKCGCAVTATMGQNADSSALNGKYQ